MNNFMYVCMIVCTYICMYARLYVCICRLKDSPRQVTKFVQL